jgi:hypothetical protein
MLRPPAVIFLHSSLVQLFADAGVMAIEHADFDGIERLALVTGARLCLLCCAVLCALWALWGL